jgi:hypothetical protein
LLEKSKKSFVKTQREEVEKLKDDMTRGMRIRPGQIGFEWKGWDQSFDKLLKELEGQEAIKVSVGNYALSSSRFRLILILRGLCSRAEEELET